MAPSNIYEPPPPFKAARKKQWCLGAGLGCVGGHIYLRDGGGGGCGSISFSKGIGGVVIFFFCPLHENVTAPSPPSNKWLFPYLVGLPSYSPSRFLFPISLALLILSLKIPFRSSHWSAYWPTLALSALCLPLWSAPPRMHGLLLVQMYWYFWESLLSASCVHFFVRIFCHLFS